MKIHILHEFIEGAWGGGNQFLKGLRDYFIDKDVYTPHPQLADVILVIGSGGLSPVEVEKSVLV